MVSRQFEMSYGLPAGARAEDVESSLGRLVDEQAHQGAAGGKGQGGAYSYTQLKILIESSTWIL